MAGLYLPRWLAEHGLAPQGAIEAPETGVVVERPLATFASPEAQYLHELSREFRSADPAIASLGRRMHEFEQR